MSHPISRALDVPMCAVALILLTAWPVGAQLRAQEITSATFDAPVAVVPVPDVPGALVVVQQGGLARIAQDGQILSTPFLDLRQVVTRGPLGERGLLGLAFDPHDPTRVFVNFTNRTGNGNTVVARFRRASALAVDQATRFDLMWPDGQRFIEQPYANHKGGHLSFGPDGFLYIGLGDGGSGNDPEHRAQDPSALLGKMLRIDVNVPDSDPVGYVVPSSNPFVDGSPIPALHEIWAFGYRNPWRYSFDDFGPGATGALIVGDVGQGAREEIDYEPAGGGGRNYGWRHREGFIPSPGVPLSPSAAYQPLQPPLFEYERSTGQAVTGGMVYRGSALAPVYRGRYFFGDSSSGRIFSLELSIDAAGEASVVSTLEHTTELGTPESVVSFGRDLSGELYFVSLTGRVYKIVPDPSQAPPGAPATPVNLRVSVTGSTASLSWQPGAGGGALTSYQVEVGSEAGASNLAVAHTSSTGGVVTGVPNGLYYVRVRGMNGAGASLPSNEVAVTVGCSALSAAPVGLNAQVHGSTVVLGWGAVNGATRYQVEAGSAPGLRNVAVIPASGPALSGLAPPGTYHVRVRALNACGAGPPSSEIVVVVR
jgi:glucose/arabinose dehydrogenase